MNASSNPIPIAVEQVRLRAMRLFTVERFAILSRLRSRAKRKCAIKPRSGPFRDPVKVPYRILHMHFVFASGKVPWSIEQPESLSAYKDFSISTFCFSFQHTLWHCRLPHIFRFLSAFSISRSVRLDVCRVSHWFYESYSLNSRS
jgi:hypothetical protein